MGDNNNIENRRGADYANGRRTVLKALASVPVFAAFGYQWSRETAHREKQRQARAGLLKELGIEEPQPAVPAQSSGGSHDHIHLGVIGCGERALRVLRAAGFIWDEKLCDWQSDKSGNSLRNWLAQEDLNVSVTGICEVFDQRAEVALGQSRNSLKAVRNGRQDKPARRYRHYRELLESSDIDAIIIATPDHHHARMTIEAMQAGKHVYCEKSLTRTEEEAHLVYETVKNSNLVFQLGHQIRQNPIYTQARQLVRNGVLGHISLVECTSNRNSPHGAWVRHLKNGKPCPGSPQTIAWEQWLGDRPRVPFSIDRYYNWTKYWDYANGLAGQLFSHEFDAVNGILGYGIPHSCMASGGTYHYRDGRDIPDVLQLVYEYPDRGMSLLYSATLMNSRQRGRVFMGSDASMEIGGDLRLTADSRSEKYALRLKEGEINPEEPFLHLTSNSGIDGVTSATARYYAGRGLTDIVIDGKKVDVTHLHIKEWFNAIRYGTPVSCGIEVSYQEAITVIMSTRSYREQRMVRWDVAKRKIV